MRKLIVSEYITLDGVTEAPGSSQVTPIPDGQFHTTATS